MPTAQQSRRALSLVTGAAVGAGHKLFGSLSGSPEQVRAALLDGVPEVVGYYSDGSAALAADFYDEQREQANAAGAYTAEPVVVDRTVKVRRAVAWASRPLFTELAVTVEQRLAEVIQFEVARPYRDTITTNTRNDPAAVGWRRVTNNCCGFCSMLARRGAVYREATARFASHPHCDCSAEPVFVGGDTGPEASVMQYVASKRGRTAAQKADLRDYLATYYPG